MNALESEVESPPHNGAVGVFTVRIIIVIAIVRAHVEMGVYLANGYFLRIVTLRQGLKRTGGDGMLAAKHKNKGMIEVLGVLFFYTAYHDCR